MIHGVSIPSTFLRSFSSQASWVPSGASGPAFYSTLATRHIRGVGEVRLGVELDEMDNAVIPRVPEVFQVLLIEPKTSYRRIRECRVTEEENVAHFQ